MGKPAARISDMHTCPMVTPGLPPIPHVGGPIVGPGNPTVLICGMPAAVMGDMCTCVGPPDTIVLGSAGVLIGGKPAARMGDQCAHGGVITVGCPTVLIGEANPGETPNVESPANTVVNAAEGSPVLDGEENPEEVPNVASPVDSGANNRAFHEVYKVELRKQMEAPYVVDPKLKEFIGELYKPNADVGSGSTAEAIRFEIATGGKVKEKHHVEKGRNAIPFLVKWLRNNPTARPGDIAAAQNILLDLINALSD